MRRSIVSAILFVVAGIFYLIAAMKGNIPIYYIFSILLLLFGGLYIKRAFTEKKVEEESKIKNSKQGLISFMVGFIVMLSLELLLG